MIRKKESCSIRLDCELHKGAGASCPGSCQGFRAALCVNATAAVGAAAVVTWASVTAGQARLQQCSHYHLARRQHDILPMIVTMASRRLLHRRGSRVFVARVSLSRQHRQISCGVVLLESRMDAIESPERSSRWSSNTALGATIRLKSNRGIGVPICSSIQLKATLAHWEKLLRQQQNQFVCRTRRHPDRQQTRAMLCHRASRPGYGDE
jgi:hypothetical protein